MAAKIQRRKMALIDRYLVLTLRQKIALAVVGLARASTIYAHSSPYGRADALVFCFSCFTASAGARESALHATASGKIIAPLSTVRFATARPNHVQRSGE